MAEKKISKLENIVWGCVGAGAAAFLGAVFGGAAEALVSLAEYALSSGVKGGLEAAEIGLACTGGAIGTGIFAGLYIWGSYAAEKSEARKAAETAKKIQDSRIYMAGLRNTGEYAPPAGRGKPESGSLDLWDSGDYEPQEREYPPDIVTSQFSATGSTGIDLANGRAVRLW